MKRNSKLAISLVTTTVLAVLGGATLYAQDKGVSAQDKYSLKSPGGVDVA